MASEQWDLWFPDAGSSGLVFARSRIADGVMRVVVHAAPQTLNVTIRDEDGRVVAEGRRLRRKERGPMCFLVRDGGQVRLEDGWPTGADLGTVVLLPGGEAGTLTAWWNDDERSEWRWSIELANTRH